jgi:predicted TIM-barrel fold metal-dependent hydrolase
MPQDKVDGVGDASRRDFLKGVAAVGGGALLSSTRLSAQAPSGKTRAIDCHHHFGSPGYAKGLAAAAKAGRRIAGYSAPSLGIAKRWDDYSPARDVEYLDQNDTATALLSSTVPGIWFGDPEETRSLARDMNEFGTRMASDYKGRFGLLALMPLPHIENTLHEIEYAFGTLKADGVCVFTSYEHHWLGDPIFRPVFDELNRRKAVVFVHPIDSLSDLMPGMGTGSLAFLTDTMLTIYSLLTTGAATRYADIRFIFSHAGGTMPSLIERFGVAEPGTYNDVLAHPAEPNSNLYHLRRFYYDAANSCNTVQLQGLKTIVGASQMVFGSDWPMIPSKDLGGVGRRQLQGLQTCGFSAAELAGIQRGNAERLLPRLKA